MNAKEILVHSLRLLENGDARGWCDLFHPEGVLEFPYAPPGWKTRFEGRETIWAHMRLFPEHLTVRFTDVQFYETADPDLAIGEFHGDGVATVSGGKLAQDYISVLRTRDGQILLYRDFWNPLRHLEALGGVEAAAKIVQEPEPCRAPPWSAAWAATCPRPCSATTCSPPSWTLPTPGSAAAPGVRQRHIAGDLGSGDLALRAASAALASAGLERVDAVVLATSTGDFCCPATAPRVAARLGLVGALAFDLSAACTGFVYGLASVGSLISAGLADSALLVGVDTFSHTLDPADRSTRALFGDGAGALVLRAGDAEEEGALLAFDLGSDGHQFDLLMTPAVSRAERSSGQASNYFRMDGKAVFGQAVTQMSDSVRRVLDRVGWQASDLHHLVPHQANTRILAAVADQLDLPVERVVSNIAEVGNTVAASIPLALAHGLRQGILRDGGNMVLTGFGAGLTWGSVALRWPKIVPTMD
ncbi:beta-ketoacyl-ACP synthase 3 [Pseudomonas aeruginosa]|nr:beta-ketoacyl-ACP synthase 3 [Pseudomonas aeruginosa]